MLSLNVSGLGSSLSGFVRGLSWVRLIDPVLPLLPPVAWQERSDPGVERGFSGLWRTLRERVVDLSPADDLAGLYSPVTTLGCARNAVVAAGPSNRTAGIHAK